MNRIIADSIVPATRAWFDNVFKFGNEEADPERPSKTRQWMERQARALAAAEDVSGAPLGTMPKDVYISYCALRFRKDARQAIRAGDLKVPAKDVCNICWVVACDVYLLRSFRAALDSAELTYEEIKRMPIFGPYHEYFEKNAP